LNIFGKKYTSLYFDKFTFEEIEEIDVQKFPRPKIRLTKTFDKYADKKKIEKIMYERLSQIQYEAQVERCGKNTGLQGGDMEKVNHPEHYQGKNECIDVMIAMFGKEAVKHFCMCNAYKYRFRADKKNGEEDIKKAEWYETKLIELGGCDEG
jgi:hypothetical protein